MKLYRLTRAQYLPLSVAEGWEFISNPHNLPRITPPSLRLSVVSPVPEKIYAGMIITYRIAPIWGIPVGWVTEITHVDAPRMFVDEQRYGPYRFWHHRHLISEKADGIEMKDVVHYALPLGPVGTISHELLVRKRLHMIFDFRRQVLQDLFGSEGMAGILADAGEHG